MKVNCIICNKEIDVKPSRIKRLKISNGICCSNECKNINKSNLYVGCDNPNIKHYYDRTFFKNIDTEEKAYILGFIASDGSIRKNYIGIYINKKDYGILKDIKNIICGSLEIKHKNDDIIGIDLNSKEMVKDVCKHLKIKTGKKSGIVGYPNLDNDLNIHFIRGVLDGDGWIRRKENRDHPECGITNNSTDLLKGIIQKTNFNFTESKNSISLSGINALDFLSLLYDNASIYLHRKFYRYLVWSSYLPGIVKGKGNNKKLVEFKVVKTHKNSIIPFKKRASDCGYDLTFIRRIKERECKEGDDVHWYGTGIKIKPAYGWYVDIVPRSSISKWGYMLTNSVGIIDRGYSGEIIAPMIKIDKTKPNPKLPVRMLQAIPRPIIHVKIVEVNDFDYETERSKNGFGSSGN